MAKEQDAPTHDKADMVFQNLLRTIGLMRQVMEPFFTKYGISGPQWGVLRVLHRAETEGHKGLRSTELGKRLLIRPPSVTGVIDRLGRMGLVNRRSNSDDRRVRTINLTVQGRQLVESIMKNYAGRIHSLFAGLTAEQCDSFMDILNQMRSHLGELTKRQR